MEELKARVEEEKKANRMLQAAREEHAASMIQCQVMMSNTKTSLAGKIEKHTQKIDSLRSQTNIQLLSAITQAKAEAETLARAERDKVDAARKEATQDVTDTVESANLEIKTRKMELLAAQKDKLAVVVEAAKMNQTSLRNEAKAAQEEAKEETTERVDHASSVAHTARKQLMKLQLRLDTAERTRVSAAAAVQKLNLKTKEYREWADTLVANLHESIRVISEKSDNAAEAVHHISTTLTAMVDKAAVSSTPNEEELNVLNISPTEDTGIVSNTTSL